MKRLFVLGLAAGMIVGCNDFRSPVDADMSSEARKGPSGVTQSNSRATPERPFKMSRSNLDLVWGIDRDQEVACQLELGVVNEPDDADHIAGGEISGRANFTHLGLSAIEMSAAWDIGNLLGPADVQFEPVEQAGGPVAPVLGGHADDYPYDFHVVNPLTGDCGDGPSATGELILTAANGDRIFGHVAGGETHRLDFVSEGDGIETFAIIEIHGGTGRFDSASGSFVIHTVTRFDFDALEFVIDLAEILPDGRIAY